MAESRTQPGNWTKDRKKTLLVVVKDIHPGVYKSVRSNSEKYSDAKFNLLEQIVMLEKSELAKLYSQNLVKNTIDRDGDLKTLIITRYPDFFIKRKVIPPKQIGGGFVSSGINIARAIMPTLMTRKPMGLDGLSIICIILIIVGGILILNGIDFKSLLAGTTEPILEADVPEISEVPSYTSRGSGGR
jgi:hypothetical protein